MLDLPAILKQAEAASEAPWWRRRDIDFSILGPPDDEHGGDLVIARASVNEDAEFIAAARTNVPLLVAALQEAQGKLENTQCPVHNRHWSVCALMAEGAEIKLDAVREWRKQYGLQFQGEDELARILKEEK